MARYIPVAEWPGSVIFASAHGRLYCAAPRGLIPDHPYDMDALRVPDARERRQWGAGVHPRMVVDVTEIADLPQRLQGRTLSIAPWNAYLVLRLDEGGIVVAYHVTMQVPRLDRSAAGQVALASGHDVEGWSAQVIQQYGNECWYFTPSDGSADTTITRTRLRPDRTAP
jgi:hypothetical protein